MTAAQSDAPHIDPGNVPTAILDGLARTVYEAIWRERMAKEADEEDREVIA